MNNTIFTKYKILKGKRKKTSKTKDNKTELRRGLK